MADDSKNDRAVPPKPNMVEMEILRDFWDAEGERHPAGTIVSIPVEAAIAGAESGALRRVKSDK